MWDITQISVMVGIVTVINALMVFVMRQLLESHRRSVAKQFEALGGTNQSQDDDITQVRKELYEFKAETARNYIHREDAIVYFGRFEQKIDAIWGYLINQKSGGPNGP